ncbi:protein sprint isoform X2 [Fopius arisanus]|uniref:Protein sprint isoform X2 n=1 Tax=Fopius arisanus TaxID=64838 RepID=A0A9R1T1Y5_9HYME|nr:PREDICTED: protein sprint isoform X2 [Fopius arisanus]
MLPPFFNIGGDILTLCRSPGDSNATSRGIRARYAEISVRRNDVFLEPYLQQRRTVEETDGSPRTPPPNPLMQQQLNHMHHVNQSSESLSSEGGSSVQGTSTADSSSRSDSGSEVACDITLIERIIRSHPIWFLPGIQRAGAFHLLQGKEEGNFVVRQSSQSDTMALSVRLPSGKGPYIEHYLIQANKGKLSLETSDNRFDNIPSLIAHYAQCCDELPVQLTLPRAMRDAKNRQQLSSLALLGQEFWRYPMANPKSPESAGSTTSSNGSSLTSFHTGNDGHSNGKNIVLNLVPISAHDSTSISSLRTCTLGSLPRQPRPTPPNTLNLTHLNEPLETKKSQLEVILSTDKNCHKLISPNLVQSVRRRSPVVHNVENNVLIPTDSKSTIDSSIQANLNDPTGPKDLDIKTIVLGNQEVVNSQPTKTPPPPPPRWAKPSVSQSQSNVTVTTTTVITLNVNQNNGTHYSDNGDKSSKPNHIGRNHKSPVISPTSKLVSNEKKTPNLMSPATPSSTSKSRRRRDREARKNSQHYQESDILESYCRSSPGDKVSDYEDIWGTNERSVNSSCWSPESRVFSPSDSGVRESLSGDRLMLLRGDRADRSREKLSYMEITSPEFSSFKPSVENKSPRGSTSPDDSIVPRRPDLLSRVCSANSLNSANNSASKTKMMSTKSESNSPMTPESKLSSPFYAEPADAIQQGEKGLVTRRRHKSSCLSSKYRHSEPGWFQTPTANSIQMHPTDWSQCEETEDKIPLISSSVDNLAKRFAAKEKKVPNRAKPVQPPKVRAKMSTDASWPVDSSWEFIGNEDEEANGDVKEINGEEKFNDIVHKKYRSKEENDTEDVDESSTGKTENDTDFECGSETSADIAVRKFPRDEAFRGQSSVNVQSIIFQRYPELFKSTDTMKSIHSDRNSSYDNVEKRRVNENELSDSYYPLDSETVDTDESDHERINRNVTFKNRLDPLLAPPRLQALKNRDAGGIGTSIRAYALLLAADKTTTFSQNIDNFIQCTMEGKEASPNIVMRNIRQFMSGMKNYLVKHGEREFEREVEKERLKLKPNEFLNLDAILEGVMMRLVVRPLREHVYKLFVDHYGATGSLKTLVESIQFAQGKHIQEFGVRGTITPPSDASLSLILKYIEHLRYSDSPLEKLENLLSAISAIFNSVKDANSDRHVTLGADDLLPLLVWVLVRGKVVDAEIEAEFMWGLLHPSLLTGEGGYYLTTLSSAVHVLKTFKNSQATMSTNNGLTLSPDCRSSVLRVLIPDELHGSLNTRTLPVRPNMNTRDICRILAHKIRCTNPQDYGLFKLIQGEETLLGDHECPQEMSHCLFAFKRIDAKIAWPKTAA